jgi:adenylate cyclase
MSLSKNSFIQVLFISIFLTLAFIGGIFQTYNHKISDNLYGGKQPLNNIIILKIDDKSIAEIGRWPWNRSVYSKVLNKIPNSSVVGFDIGFYEESNILSDSDFSSALEKKNNIVLGYEFISFYRDDNDELIGKDTLLPLENFSKYTEIGYVNFEESDDGIVRNVKFDFSSKKAFTQQIYELYQ